MRQTSIRLPEELLDDLGEEAETRGFSSRAHYIRHILQHRDRVFDRDSDDIDRDSEGIEKRLNNIEKRLEALEPPTDTGPNTPESRSIPDGTQADIDRDSPNTKDTDRDSLEDQMEEKLDELHVPGHDSQIQRARREAIRFAWHYLREQGSTKSGDISRTTFGKFFDEPIDYTTAARNPAHNMWDGCVRDILKQLPGVDPPAQRGSTWRFDPTEA